MSDAYESDFFLFYEDLTSEAQAALREALAADAELAEAFARWQRLRASVRASLQEALPDRSLLVLYALEAGAYAEVLSDEEQHLLNQARPRLKQALEQHPALADVVAQIQQEAADFDAAWDAAARPAAAERSDRPARPRARRQGLRWAWRVGAGAALVAFLVLTTMLVRRDLALVTVATAGGETRLVELADGSTARLLENSTLTYADPGKATSFNRRVRLAGAAFFEVVKDQEGFAVETSTALATVLGTSFGVRADEEVTEVTLATGRVAVAPREAADRIVVLEPGQTSRIARGALPTTPVAVDLSEALDWTGLFIFREATVEAIARRLGEHYRAPVTAAPTLEAQPLTGTFQKDQPLEDVLATLAVALGADVEALPGGGYALVPARE